MPNKYSALLAAFIVVLIYYSDYLHIMPIIYSIYVNSLVKEVCGYSMFSIISYVGTEKYKRESEEVSLVWFRHTFGVRTTVLLQ